MVVVGDARPRQRCGQRGGLGGHEQEARAAVADRVDEPAGRPCHRQGAVAHGDQLREAARLEAGGNDQRIGAGVDAARQALVVADPPAQAFRVRRERREQGGLERGIAGAEEREVPALLERRR